MIKIDNGDSWYNIMTFMKEMLFKVGNRAVLVVISDLLYIGMGDWFELYTAVNTKLLQLYQLILIAIIEGVCGIRP